MTTSITPRSFAKQGNRYLPKYREERHHRHQHSVLPILSLQTSIHQELHDSPQVVNPAPPPEPGQGPPAPAPLPPPANTNPQPIQPQIPNPLPLHPPPPPPLMQGMATTPSANKSGPKVKTPSPFSGQKESSRLLILECKIYFRAKPKEFVDDAGALDEQRKKYEEKDNYRTWKEFEDSFVAQFADANVAANARTKLSQIRQRKCTADNFIAEFANLVSESEITESPALIEYFMEALNPAIVKEVYQKNPILTKIEDWYKDAATADNQWRKLQSFLRRHHSSQKDKRSWVPRGSKARNPDAMDVDRGKERKEWKGKARVQATNTLSDKDKKQYMDEGHCFRCSKTGHQARDCPDRDIHTKAAKEEGGSKKMTVEELKKVIRKLSTEEKEALTESSEEDDEKQEDF
ncbi:hypothetical protein EW146_g2316 [Bondarzewia mesenterica]|uniref:CCHC-type domain-containing protein n=1 Tax=Bondarzewia mesenterica TaxID=1095465 RepID=A0A4S4M150_9AGAM|nr:hypothetical protein EW146_g2316 [Bondarzewia mesenterica]